MNAEEILKFARKSIYGTVERLGEWRGYEVWEPGFSDDEEHCVGFPSFILIRGDSIRWTRDWEESRAVMRRFYKPDDEEEED